MDRLPAATERVATARWRARCGVVWLAVHVGSAAWAQGGLIYSCIDASGKKITRDRYIAECSSREQRVLNSDGSLRQLLQPTPTADERGEIEARERAAALEREHQQEAVRRDRNLRAKFPNEATHRKARQAALEDLRKSVKLSQERLAALAAERKPLTDETEFYVGKQMPAKLKGQLDANDASADAQRSLLQNQLLEIARIDQLYDAELERLRKLWSGAQPGSLGMIAGAAASAPPRK